MSKLSDLELVALGVVWKRGPCTSYAVMKELAGSPSSHWSGSAGAIYPAVKRLTRQGYLSCAADPVDRRGRRLYRIAPKGTAALKRWLVPPHPQAAALFTYDPIRTQTYFLGVLSSKQRAKFLDACEAALREQVPVVADECERYRRAGDEFSALAVGGARYVIRARLEWIADLRAQFARME